MDEEWDARTQRIRAAVEEHLHTAFSRFSDQAVSRAAMYAVLGGGHRWRAMAAVAAGEIFHPDGFRIALPGGCGVELAHAASLILDDLPSMDNAAIRRGKPCVHSVFPQWAVDMAPVFLVTLAYHCSMDNPLSTHERRVATALELSRAGLQMIDGQEHDLTDPTDENDEQRLLRCYRLKSGALYAAAAKIGAVLCGAGEVDAALIYAAGMDLGLSYQLLDDVADVVAGVAEVGKQPGMDAGKLTAIDLFGLDGARRRRHAFQESALDRLQPFGPAADWMRRLICQAGYASR